MAMVSETFGALATALAKAQAEMTTVSKDARNPHFKSTFATLAAVREACYPLSQHGLAVVQITRLPQENETAHIILETRIIHGESGEWVGSTYPVIPEKNTAQGVGSALTYARRYSLMALVGLAPEDDDGHDAGKHRQRREERRERRHPREHPAIQPEPKHEKPSRPVWMSEAEARILGDRAANAPGAMGYSIPSSTDAEKTYHTHRIEGGGGWTCTCRAGETTKRGEPVRCRHALASELQLYQMFMGPRWKTVALQYGGAENAAWSEIAPGNKLANMTEAVDLCHAWRDRQ